MTLVEQPRIELSDFKPAIYRDVPTLLRLIQSIPSPKDEPFKRWPAKVGHERISGLEKADKFSAADQHHSPRMDGLERAGPQFMGSHFLTPRKSMSAQFPATPERKPENSHTK